MTTGLPFADRPEAGRLLGAALHSRLDADADADVVVLGLPRGGVPVAAEVADALGAPLDVLVVRKLGAPGHPELAVGAVAAGGVRVLNEGLLRELAVGVRALDRVTRAEVAELRRREAAFRGNRPSGEPAGRTAVLVDDGLATGATVLAAVQAVRVLAPARVVVAVPVGAAEACERVAAVADELVCLHCLAPFGAVGRYYRDFRQTSDDEVRRLLAARADR